MKWQGTMKNQVKSYMTSFAKFREKICVPKAESIFTESLKKFRGQGYWIPELKDDVDVESISLLIPEFEKKLAWIKKERAEVEKKKSLPDDKILNNIRHLLSELLKLKKGELSSDEAVKTASRKASLKLMGRLASDYETLIKKVSFLSNYQHPVDHLKNRKVHDEYREKEDEASVKVANYTFLYRKLLEDGAYNSDHTGSDIYLRTTIDTLYFELKQHDFYLSEDARFDLEFVLGKIESELKRGKTKIVERLTEWEERTARTLSFYKSLTLAENNLPITIDGRKTTANRVLIEEHNKAADALKKFVYTKQAEVYNYWLHQPELARAIFVLETILLNEVGGVDGDDALERMDVARVVMNRLDKPKYLVVGKKELLYPYIKKVISDSQLKSERWLNALFKQGEFSFTYYYMSSSALIFCPDMAQGAKKLRAQNVEIALQVLKEQNTSFQATRYFSRASMIGRIHMDSIWEDYIPYPERPGLLAEGQETLRGKLRDGQYTFLYGFQDPSQLFYQVLEIDGKNYAMAEKNGIKLFYYHRNPHYFRYFTKTESL